MVIHLIRKLVNEEVCSIDDFVKDLLEPHRCYYSDIQKLINVKIKIKWFVSYYWRWTY